MCQRRQLWQSQVNPLLELLTLLLLLLLVVLLLLRLLDQTRMWLQYSAVQRARGELLLLWQCST